MMINIEGYDPIPLNELQYDVKISTKSVPTFIPELVQGLIDKINELSNETKRNNERG